MQQEKKKNAMYCFTWQNFMAGFLNKSEKTPTMCEEERGMWTHHAFMSHSCFHYNTHRHTAEQVIEV